MEIDIGIAIGRAQGIYIGIIIGFSSSFGRGTNCDKNKHRENNGTSYMHNQRNNDRHT